MPMPKLPDEEKIRRYLKVNEIKKQLGIRLYEAMRKAGVGYTCYYKYKKVYETKHGKSS